MAVIHKTESGETDLERHLGEVGAFEDRAMDALPSLKYAPEKWFVAIKCVFHASRSPIPKHRDHPKGLIGAKRRWSVVQM